MAELQRLVLKECSCTQDTDCARCISLGRIGDMYIEDNGSIGVAYLMSDVEGYKHLIELMKETGWR